MNHNSSSHEEHTPAEQCLWQPQLSLATLCEGVESNGGEDKGGYEVGNVVECISICCTENTTWKEWRQTMESKGEGAEERKKRQRERKRGREREGEGKGERGGKGGERESV